MSPSSNNTRFTIENNVLKGTEISYDNDIKNFGKSILECLENNLDFVGLIDAVTNEEFTYRMMKERSVRCALWLRSQGLLPRDIIAICSDNRVDYITPCLAALYLGAIFNPWDANSKIEGFCHRMNVTKPKIVFVNEGSVAAVAEAVKRAKLDTKIVVFGGVPGFLDFGDIIAEPEADEVEGFVCAPIESLEEIAVILFSSGSTGPPKGVALSHGSLTQQQRQPEAFGISGNVGLIFMTPDWITWILLSPPMINRLLKYGAAKEYDLSSITKVIHGGTSLSVASCNALAELLPDADILSGYGLTEFGNYFSVQTNKSKPGSCGQLLSNSQLKVRDIKTGRTLAANERGELLLKGPFMMPYYYDNPQATGQAFDKEGRLISGDFGYYDEDGEVFVIDRLKEIIRLADYDICPSEIENVILSHPGVKEVAVVGQPRDDGEDVVVIFAVRTVTFLENGKEVTENEILDFVFAEIPDHRQLRTVVKFIEEIPRTGTSKIQRLALRELARSIMVSL